MPLCNEVQIPVIPALAALAFKLVLLPQMVLLVPALATSFIKFTERVIWSELEGHPGFETVHSITTGPTASPVTKVVLLLGSMIVPVPDINVQVPLPTSGNNAFRLVLELHNC